MRTDAIADILFYKTSDGGRKSHIFGEFYACPIIINDVGYDCRINIKGKLIELGKCYELEITFLNRESAMKSIKVGKEFDIWEGKIIGKGAVKIIK